MTVGELINALQRYDPEREAVSVSKYGISSYYISKVGSIEPYGCVIIVQSNESAPIHDMDHAAVAE